MECSCHLLNVQDLLSDGKTPQERRFEEQFVGPNSRGPSIPFGANVEYHPISAKDQARLHQFGKKVLPGVYMGCALYTGGSWKGDEFVADAEELQENDASDVYSIRMNTKYVLVPIRRNKFTVPFVKGSTTLAGKDFEIPRNG